MIERYRVERMPTRIDTKRSYETWIQNHIIPKWGDCKITDLEPRPVELWLGSLALAPKSKTHIRGVLRNLWDFAAWSGEVPREQRNPMELVRIKDASKRLERPGVSPLKSSNGFAAASPGAIPHVALLCCCLGFASVSVLR